jgi:hypothetical protein
MRVGKPAKVCETAIGLLDEIPSFVEVVTAAAVVGDPQRQPGRFGVHGDDFEQAAEARPYFRTQECRAFDLCCGILRLRLAGFWGIRMIVNAAIA